MTHIITQGVEVHLTRRGKYWQADWRTDEGRFRRSTGETRLAAAKLMVEKLVKREISQQPTGKMTLAMGLERIWRERWRHTSSGQQRRVHVEDAITVLGNPDLQDIRYRDLVKLQEHWLAQGISDSTVNRKITSVRTILGAAVHPWEILKAAPKSPRLRETEGDRLSLTEDQIKALLDSAPDEDWRHLWVFLLHTGARRSELLHICDKTRWSAFALDTDRPMVTLVGKGNATARKKIRHLPLTADLAAFLKTKRDSGVDKPWNVSVQILRAAWDNYRTLMGQQDNPAFVFHCLRHTCATQRILKGQPAAAVQAWMGHSSFATTQRYIRQVGADLHQWSDFGPV